MPERASGEKGGGGVGFHTLRFGDQFNDVPYSDVDNTEEALVLLFEFLLVEDLDGQDAVLVDLAAASESRCSISYWWRARTYKSKLSFQYGLSVRLDTCVVFVCSPLMVATAKGSGNPADGVSTSATTTRHRGRTQLHTEDISLVETIGGDDWRGPG